VEEAGAFQTAAAELVQGHHLVDLRRGRGKVELEREPEGRKLEGKSKEKSGTNASLERHENPSSRTT